MTIARTLSDYRWPIMIGGLLSMSVISSGVLVYVATRPDAPRPIPGYYEAAESWDAAVAAEASSGQLGWSVKYELPADVPHEVGMPRPVDVVVADRNGAPVMGLAGTLSAVRPSDGRRNQRGTLSEIPAEAGHYRTLIRLDEPGLWELRIDTTQQSTRFVHTTRVDLTPTAIVGRTQ